MRVIILSDRARVGGRTGENESEKKEEKIQRSKVREEKEERHIFRYLSDSGTLSHPSARLEVRLWTFRSIRGEGSYHVTSWWERWESNQEIAFSFLETNYKRTAFLKSTVCYKTDKHHLWFQKSGLRLILDRAGGVGSLIGHVMWGSHGQR